MCDIPRTALDVPSLDEVVARVEAAGGTQKTDAVPGVGWLAEVEDTEGNRWGLMQEDPAAHREATA